MCLARKFFALDPIAGADCLSKRTPSPTVAKSTELFHPLHAPAAATVEALVRQFEDGGAAADEYFAAALAWSARVTPPGSPRLHAQAAARRREGESLRGFACGVHGMRMSSGGCAWGRCAALSVCRLSVSLCLATPCFSCART